MEKEVLADNILLNIKTTVPSLDYLFADLYSDELILWLHPLSLHQPAVFLPVNSVGVKHPSTFLHTRLESKIQSMCPTAGQWVRWGARDVL